LHGREKGAKLIPRFDFDEIEKCEKASLPKVEGGNSTVPSYINNWAVAYKNWIGLLLASQQGLVALNLDKLIKDIEAPSNADRMKDDKTGLPNGYGKVYALLKKKYPSTIQIFNIGGMLNLPADKPLGIRETKAEQCSISKTESSTCSIATTTYPASASQAVTGTFVNCICGHTMMPVALATSGSSTTSWC
jgi:hypothetical protein